MAVKWKSNPGLAIDSYLKDIEFTATKRDAAFQISKKGVPVQSISTFGNVFLALIFKGWDGDLNFPPVQLHRAGKNVCKKLPSTTLGQLEN